MPGRTSQEAGAKVGGLFNLVLIMSTRVRELKRGHAPKIVTTHGPSVTALLEVEQGKVGTEYLKKIRDER
jgi:DNA-directed RNA polymerase subunit K/omega